jgi:hypothetical protein
MRRRWYDGHRTSERVTFASGLRSALAAISAGGWTRNRLSSKARLEGSQGLTSTQSCSRTRHSSNPLMNASRVSMTMRALSRSRRVHPPPRRCATRQSAHSLRTCDGCRRRDRSGVRLRALRGRVVRELGVYGETGPIDAKAAPEMVGVVLESSAPNRRANAPKDHDIVTLRE